MSDGFADALADQPPSKAVTREALGKIAEMLERNDIPLEEVGRISRVNMWQGLTKDEMGDPVVTDLVGLSFTPRWADGPEWPVVQQAKPTVVRYPPAAKRDATDGWERAVVLPDPQIGYRRDMESGELDPLHDERAMDVALQVVRMVKPHRIVNLGDTLDLAEWGTYEQEPGFAFTTQAAIDRAHRFLAQQRAAAGPDCTIELLEGNHDRRIEKAVRRNAMAAFGLKRANEPDGWPVMSVPFLLRLDELDVTYVGGYPAGITWINDNLACVHGHKVRSNGSTAAAVIDDERVSVLFGHVHRIELQHKTRRIRAGLRQSLAASPGCLCRTDGAVPSTRSSSDPLGRPVLGWENWQQGVAVVEYEPGNGWHALELVPIIEGWARFRGVDLRA